MLDIWDAYKHKKQTRVDCHFFIVKAEYVKKASQRCSFATIMEAQRYSYLYDMGQIY